MGALPSEGVTEMEMIPWTVVLRVKRTRTGWVLEIRVQLFT
tara:strand:- start:189 stop:311 length:123 start_codon:yes stop_codon:yes gene_type:complete